MLRPHPFARLMVLSLTVLLLLLIPGALPVSAVPMATETAISHLIEAAQAQGTVPVIVRFRVPEYEIRPLVRQADELEAEQRAIARDREALLKRLVGQGISHVKRYDIFPFVAMTVDAAALEALRADPQVLSIVEDVLVEPMLGDSVPLVTADRAHLLNYTGAGQTIAILDTGVDRAHPRLAGKVVSGACYSSTNSSLGLSSVCPGGVPSSTSLSASINCAVNGCDHGTHVASIAAAVAPGADIIAIQVFSRQTDSTTGGPRPCADRGKTSPCIISLTSDILLGLQRVFALRSTFDIASINMSLGGGEFDNQLFCDTANGHFGSGVKVAIDDLRGAGITTVIAAGNDGFRNALGSPGCISTAISVGATTKDNVVASYSNVASFLTLFAPGSGIVAALPGGGTGTKDGTSMAAPHVAGAIAIFKQAKLNATADEIRSYLTTRGPFITDTRSGGTVLNKRRLDVYASLCIIITCDSDDNRTITVGSSFNGAITPSNDVDHYYFNGTASTRLTLQMEVLAGLIDPHLRLYDPNGTELAVNNNGGAGLNALINGYLLPVSGRYLIRATSSPTFLGGTGTYRLSASSQIVLLNPIPGIDRLVPSSVTANLLASDFWVKIEGSGFMPTSQTTWNGNTRTMSYSSPSRIYIRVRAGDIFLPGTASVRVRNPGPGGGTSNTKSFVISIPFLGVSELVAPPAGSTTSVGVTSSFVISWTHPSASWRTMQNMDLRLRDENNNTSLWVRLSEGVPEGDPAPPPEVRYRLLNASEQVIAEGLPGEARDLVLTDTVTLHLDQSTFSGSNRTVIMTPTVTFGPAAVGTYHIEFRVDNQEGEIQDGDLFGSFTILPVGCTTALSAIDISGPTTGVVGAPTTFNAAISPLSATAPISYTWAPEPSSGQGTATATYYWSAAGTHPVSVNAQNCGDFVADIQDVAIRTTTQPDLSISKEGAAVATAGQPITYTLTVTNSGEQSASNLLISDAIPAGATYIRGGTRSGTNVSWQLPELGGYGAVAQATFVVSTASTITNSNYSVSADGGAYATGSQVVQTQIVDSLVQVGPMVTGTLSYGSWAAGTGAELRAPQGSVFDDTTLTYREWSAPESLPSEYRYGGRAFRVEGYQGNRLIPDLTLAEEVTFRLAYDSTALGGLNATALHLYRWNGSGWSAEGIQCMTEVTAGEVVCTAMRPALGNFALLVELPRLYLPLLASALSGMR
ncbi:MAG: S8 family serine peptidase [Ardenticatenales bacterium]|nr:S8 family serine peptidase [Ardenticatenales bacterium]